MPVIELKPATCKHCGAGRRTINIKSFKKDFIHINENVVKVLAGKRKCWTCKTLPKNGEHWGLSINHKERNRLFCPTCVESVEKKLNLDK